MSGRARRPPELEARPAHGLSPEAAAALLRQGYVLYSLGTGEPRSHPRVRTRLSSAKVIDGDNAFLCEAILHDRSPGGMRLRLARNIGLPARFGVHDDQNGALYTVSQAWRRGLTVGVRIHAAEPPRPMRPVERAALGGLYYAVRD